MIYEIGSNLVEVMSRRTYLIKVLEPGPVMMSKARDCDDLLPMNISDISSKLYLTVNFNAISDLSFHCNVTEPQTLAIIV